MVLFQHIGLPFNLDYQLGAFWIPHDCLRSHRVTSGVEHRLLPWLFVRGGMSFDARGNIGGTCDASIIPARWCSSELGYQYDVYPELRPEFGRSHTLQLNFAVRL